uniref:Uncharacterized protein n=1 Tax=Anguilla anguilla TaxID=7936 RepID=A0A0E9T301_ANGAN
MMAPATWHRGSGLVMQELQVQFPHRRGTAIVQSSTSAILNFRCYESSCINRLCV